MNDKLTLILAHSGRNTLELWACRGHGKGCKRNLFRVSKSPCDDCFGPLPNDMRLGEVQKRLAQGDA